MGTPPHLLLHGAGEGASLSAGHPLQVQSHELARCVMRAACDLFGYRVWPQLVCSLVPEEARAKAEVENQWRQFVNDHSDGQQRALPDFRSHILREDIAAAVPQDLRQGCLDLLAALP